MTKKHNFNPSAYAQPRSEAVYVLEQVGTWIAADLERMSLAQPLTCLQKLVA